MISHYVYAVRAVVLTRSIIPYALLDNFSVHKIKGVNVANKLVSAVRTCVIRTSTLHVIQCFFDLWNVILVFVMDNISVRVDTVIHFNRQPVEIASLFLASIRALPHLSKIEERSLEMKDVGLLIGCDVLEAHLNGDYGEQALAFETLLAV